MQNYGKRGGIESRVGGKTLAQEKAIAAHLKKHPKATIVRVSSKGTKVEKHVEELGPLRLERKSHGD